MHVKSSFATLKKAIKSIGICNRIAAKKPFLNEKHKKERLSFAKQHQHWLASDWKNVI